MSMPSDGQSAPPPPSSGKSGGMSTAAIILIVLGSLAAVGALVCCGGMFWGMKQFGQMVSNDPATVRQVANDITTMTVPEEFPPLGSFQIPGAFRMAFFGVQAGTKTFMLMEGGAGKSAEQMRQQLDQQAQLQGGGTAVTSQDMFTRDVNIRGQATQVQFIRGVANVNGENVEVFQVSGAFQGKGGPAIFLLTVPVAEWDEQRIVIFLESMQ